MGRLVPLESIAIYFNLLVDVIVIGPVYLELEDVGVLPSGTQNTMRDEDLRSVRFLDVDKFPLMIYSSNHFTPELGGTGRLTVI